MKRIVVLSIVIVACCLIASGWMRHSTARAQSGTVNPQYSNQYQAGGQYQGAIQNQASSGTVQAQQTFESKFWSYLLRSEPAYRNWAPWPGQGADYYPGQSPHGAFLKMYINRTAAADPVNLPHGSVIIKENYGEDQKTLMAVTVMYRSQGYDSQNGDWYWAKYNPDGTVAMKGDVRLAGRVQGCIDCHSGAQGNDFVFANDNSASP